MGRPRLRCYAGFGSTWQTEPGAITWTDLSGRLMDRRAPISCRRGSSPFKAEPDPGQLTLTLRNSDRHLDETYTAGPYFGLLRAGVPIKLEAIVEATGEPLTWDGEPLTWDGEPLTWGAETRIARWYGTVPKWPQHFDRGGKIATVPIVAYDGFDKISRTPTPRSAVEAEVLADQPAAYWKLDETSGSVMVDSSGNSRHGTIDNATLGEPPLVADGTGGSVLVAHTGDNRGLYKGETLPAGPPCTIEAWVKVERNLDQAHTVLTCQRDHGNDSSRLELSIETETTGSPNGELVIYFRGLGGSYRARGVTRIDDGDPHHVVVLIGGITPTTIRLYIDGHHQPLFRLSGTNPGAWPGHNLWCIGNVPASGPDRGLGGHIDEVAIYDHVLLPARILAHYEAGANAFRGHHIDQRATWLFDQIGWPTGLRDLAAGHSPLAPATFDDADTVLGYLTTAARTEDGLMFIKASGHLRILDRYWRYLDPAATIPQIELTDDGSGIGVASFVLEPSDDELLVNIARFTRRGGAQQVETDTVSSSTYGTAELTRTDLLHQTDAETRGLAQWVVRTRSTPHPRVKSALIRVHKLSAADQIKVLNLDLGHRIRCIRTPQGVGDPFITDCVVANIEDSVQGQEYLVEVQLEPAPDVSVALFTLGTSELGGTDILAY